MSRIFCIVGKSASGKDTLYKEILSLNYPHLISVIPYTTRPKRIGENDGIDYHFVDEGQLQAFEENGDVIEKRQYFTTQGIWTYFTLKFDIKAENDYILITTLEGASKIVKYYGSDVVHIIYLVVDDKTRLIRCIERESNQKSPDYSEVCRRFIADQKDFSDDNINAFEKVHYIDTGADTNSCLEKWKYIYENP